MRYSEREENHRMIPDLQVTISGRGFLLARGWIWVSESILLTLYACFVAMGLQAKEGYSVYLASDASTDHTYT